ncbi:MAG: hypothetical protein ACRCYU_12365 [Nocardioides sp.]
MTLRYGKREIAKVVDALEAGHETAEDAAAAAIAAAEEIFEARAKFVVVGQLAHSREDGDLAHDDPRAIKVSLGWYSTEADARSAAKSLWTSTQSGDRFRNWVLPVHHGTPAELHAERKAAHQAAEQKLRDKAADEFRKSVQKYAQERQESSLAVMGEQGITDESMAELHPRAWATVRERRGPMVEPATEADVVWLDEYRLREDQQCM